MSTLSSRAVWWIVLAIFLLPIILIEYGVLQFTGGTFSYPVDDTFIHLAIARNLAHYNVWGISPHGFVSASSSVLYPLLLTMCIKIFGSYTIIPFIVNLLAGIAFLYVLHRWLIKQQITTSAQLIVLTSVTLLIPLPVIVMSGMEHTLQILFCFLFLTRYSEEVANMKAQSSVQKEKRDWSFSWQLFLYGFLMTAVRYEGIVLIGIACLILLFHRQWFASFQLGLLCLIPIISFGIISIYQGSYFIPNSVLIKSGAPPMTSKGLWHFISVDIFDKLSLSGGDLMASIYNNTAVQRLFFILLLSYILFLNSIQKNKQYQYLLILLITSCFAHILLTGYGRFPRYEAYLMGNGVIITGMLFAKYGRQVLANIFRHSRWVAVIIALFLIIPIFMRSVDSIAVTKRASINIYQQQYQMGLFLGKYYHDTPIAFNDIGAASYFTQGNNLDLWGLGNLDVTRSIKEHYYSGPFLFQLSKYDSVQIAVVFERYFQPELLSRWDKIASWRITSKNVICADDSVSFYAVRKGTRDVLAKNLHEFEPLLPKGVAVRYY